MGAHLEPMHASRAEPCLQIHGTWQVLCCIGYARKETYGKGMLQIWEMSLQTADRLRNLLISLKSP